jgi:hypothetical protein
VKRLLIFLVSVSAIIGIVSPTLASAKVTEKKQPQLQSIDAVIALTPEEIEKQREAERLLEEAERVRQQNRNNNSGDGYVSPEAENLERRTNNAVDRLRGSFGNEQQLRESQAEVENLRRERIRLEREYQRETYFHPGSSYYNSTPITPGSASQSPPSTQIEIYPNTQPEVVPLNPVDQLAPEFVTPKNLDLGTASVSLGFKDGAVNPAIGYRFAGSPIAIELGTVLNQDRLPPGDLKDFSIPDSLLQSSPGGFNNLGEKTTTPQIGADLIGYYNVSPTVALYGGVGLYFQGRSSILQSNVTSNLYKQTNSTDTNVAVSGGADLKLGDSWRLGGGYHSLRGVTAKISYDF